MQCIIYKITSPSNKIYIGQTLEESVENRYRYGVSKKQTKLYRSVNKYGWDNHKKEILEVLDSEDALFFDERECYWIIFYDSVASGLNCRGGGSMGKLSEEAKKKIGEKSKGRKPSELNISEIKKANTGRIKSREEKTKISEAKKGNKDWLGKKHSEETKKKIAIKALGRKLSDEAKNKISEKSKGRIPPNKGKLQAEETKKKIAIKALGRKLSDEAKNKISEKSKGRVSPNKGKISPTSKKIVCINNNIIYDSISIASKELNINRKSIREVCQGKLKETKGFFFKYF